MPNRIRQWGLERHVSERASIHYGGKIREGVLMYIEKEDLFFLDCPEGKIEIGDNEKIGIRGKEYLTDIK